MTDYSAAHHVLDQLGYTDYIINPGKKSLRIEKITLDENNNYLLDILEGFETIEGDLEFHNFEHENFNCLNGLKTVRVIKIVNNNKVKSISGFASLSKIRSLIIEKNTSLESITGFGNLFVSQSRVPGNIKIIDNKLLTSIGFLRGLKNVGLSLYLHHNSLDSLEGLEDLKSIGASFSLSSNKLISLKSLSKLKQIGGMLGLVNNQLTNLEGLEGLQRVNTVIWNGKKRTIAISHNEKLKDISALSNVKADDDYIIMVSDSDVMEKKLPDNGSKFFSNTVIFRDKNNQDIYQSYKANDFPKIKKIEVKNAVSNDLHPVSNLIQGKGKGFEHIPPYSSISRNFWSTKKVGKSGTRYFDFEQPILIDIELEFEEKFDAIALWPSRRFFGNSIKDFLIQTGNSFEELGLSVPIQRTANNKNPFDAELFHFNNVSAKFLRITIISNHFEAGVGGECVDFQEVAVVRNYLKIKSEISTNNDRGLKSDLIRPLLMDKLDDLHYRILNINPEFCLDDIWHPGMTYQEFIAARGLGGRGRQLRRIKLATIGDKIHMYHLLKEYGIKGMPVKLYSNRLEESFFHNVRRVYEEGLKSFVLKVSHLGDSIGVYRVQNGVHIPPNETAGSNYMTGKSVDFAYLEKEIRNHWNNQQYHEDWVSNAIPPGVILEELIEDATEIKFSVVFGQVVCFFIRSHGLPCFDQDGNPLTNIGTPLPDWWREALTMAEKVARIFKADHLRVDIFRREGELIICEVNWNGAERYPTYPMIENALNYGYQYRQDFINTKIN